MSTERTTSALRVLATQLGADGGLLAEALLDDDRPDLGPDDPGLGTLAAAGPPSTKVSSCTEVALECLTSQTAISIFSP